MSNYTFASMPSVSIARSKFVRPFAHNVSFNLGELVVLGIDECIPGSTHRIDMGSLIRMSTPIAPIMDDLQYDVFSFVCPLRLTWDHFKNFMGESDNAGISLTTYTIPKIMDFLGSEVNTPADDFGLVPKETVTYATGDNAISILPFRALALIYNRFFRNQNVEGPIPVYKGDTVTPTELSALNMGFKVYNNGSPVSYGTSRLKAYKLPDYYTSSLPYSQKGDPVRIPGDIPVMTGPEHSVGTGYPLKGRQADGTIIPSGAHTLGIYSTGTDTEVDYTSSSYSSAGTFQPSNLWAYSKLAVNNTINDLRFAFQLQKALEKDALYGSRYWEVLRAHYATTSPDASLQDPELLGHVKFDINISQVLQTTGFTSPSSTNLGTPGANSVTAHRDHVCTFSVTEHCYLIHIGVARQKRHTYSQGMNRMWFRNDRWDFYHPVFANLGAQKVLQKELYFDGNTPQDGVFGFQESWAEYRFIPNFNSGLLNPARTNSLDYWTLADKYSSQPTLSKSFLQEDRSNLARALVTGVGGPDFIGSFYIKDTVVNPMPLYSIPGFADHH